MARRLKIGLALGGGAARGWAHFGVLRYLTELGIHPDIIAGTSIGAIVGGAYASGRAEVLEEWALELNWQDIIGLMDLSFSGGLMQGHKLMGFFEQHFENTPIESLDKTFGAVATDLANGQEVWLNRGPLLSAIRASIALPGLLAPVDAEARWLVDGGLVNPVPVSLCRALGADRVIAVDLNAYILSRRAPLLPEPEQPNLADKDIDLQQLIKQRDWKGLYQATLGDHTEQWRQHLLQRSSAPNLVDVLAQSVYIMQMRITRARMAGDPPDVLLTPRLNDIRLMDFHRAAECLEQGYLSAQRVATALQNLLEDP